MRQSVQARPAPSRRATALPPPRAFGPALAAPSAGAHDFAQVAVSAPVQRTARGDAPDEHIRLAARDGVRTPAAGLPFADRIQQAFGRHRVDGIRAHRGPAAERSATAMRANAFATGEHVVFGAPPTLRTAAHEAAHVVQQRRGVRLAGGVGREGDAYERHADAVAGAVVAGRSAEPLLEPFAAPTGAGPRSADGAAPSPPTAPHAGAPGPAVQRDLMVNGQPADLSKLLAQTQDPKERVILANWGWSKTQHNFEAKDDDEAHAKLRQAVTSARAQPKDAPGLFGANNLKFLTKAPNREPTLYFKSGSSSGRLRQQHGSGPVVGTETNKADYFFATKEHQKAFGVAAKKAMKTGKAFDPSRHVHSTEPNEGSHHYEVTYGAGGKVKKVHPSGGTVVTNVDAYKNDSRLKAIYQKIIGHTT